MKYTREWFFGKEKRQDDDYVSDYVSAYIAENGRRIDVHYYTNTCKAYLVDGQAFETLKEAKAEIEKEEEERQ